MRAGRLRQLITIQSRTEVKGAAGGRSYTWATFATVRAEVAGISGREYLAAQQIQAEITHRVLIRYLSGVKAEMRILWGTRTLEILTVLESSGRNTELTLMCKELIQ